MTKLIEWLIGGITFIGIWLAVLFGYDYSTLDIKLYYVLLWLPILVLVIFGIYAVAIILYRVFTFNDCQEAASELQEQIKQAVVDLTSKGIRLRSK